MEYGEFFKQATGCEPFFYQIEMARGGEFPSLLEAPTGMGKTAAAILGWVWRRQYADPGIRAATPRRLVYCLPMRVLVEQTRTCAVTWLSRLGILGGMAEFVDGDGGQKLSYNPWAGDDASDKIRVHLLMGGDVDRDWDMYPERDAILIGTQDLLLSRALNRGYALSRFRWPVQFGLINNDCLWVMDEIQLMGNGLATSTQLQAFRRKFSTTACVRSLWMSATLHEDWLKTVDFDSSQDAPGRLTPKAEDRNSTIFRKRYEASKPISRATFEVAEDGREMALLAEEVHTPGTRTLIVVNTVKRSQAVYQELKKLKGRKQSGLSADLVLLHSRFRPKEREYALTRLLATPGEHGTIAVCTQVVEAGVDISARMLITELAPWPSLVQRFGRCNRYGEYDQASIIWIPYANLDDGRKLNSAPYGADELRIAAVRLKDLADAGPQSLPPVSDPLEFSHVLRRKDIIELFDTTPDLAGADIDVSRFIREGDEHDVQVFWRDIPEAGPGPGEKGPGRDELCSVPINKDLKDKERFWRWDHLENRWSPLNQNALYPGLVLMLAMNQGGYNPELGWTGKEKTTDPVDHAASPEPESYDGDGDSSAGSWQTIAEHTDLVVHRLNWLLKEGIDGLRDQELAALMDAARWHDAGKAHDQFQQAIQNAPVSGLWGKSATRMKPYKRRGFRHELASALAMLAHGMPDLAAYLAAAHHGKVRLSIRSLPHEIHPSQPGVRFARGIREKEILPEAELGGGISSPETTLCLSYMEMGDDPLTGPSWLARMLTVRDAHGPFRLAFLEALLRIADWHASALQENHHA